MSTNSTASSYIVKINQDYPVAGQDNNSQGFRDNFKNIKLALNSTDEVLYNLSLNAVSVSNTTTNFNHNTVEKISIKNSSYKVFDKSATLVYGNEAVDYSLGHYQKYKLATGQHIFTVINWPPSNNQGFLTLEVTGEIGSSINFSAIGSGKLYNLGPASYPLILAQNETYIFELWNGGNTNNLYVKSKLDTLDAENNSIRIGTNFYVTGTNFETVVSNGEKYGTIGIVQNIVTTTITTVATDFPGDTTANKFGVANDAGIANGAKVALPNSTQTHVVTNIANNIITVSPSFTIGLFAGTEVVTFLNPRFENQPTLLTLRSQPVTSTAGEPGDYKGQVYISTNTLWIAYDDYNGTKNWFSIASSGAASLGVGNLNTNNSSGTAATTAFVHSVLPYGTIVMWYGSVEAIPSGWALCDGTNSTPDLRNRFVLGAGSTYAVNTTGGSTNTVVVSHTHSASVTNPGNFITGTIGVDTGDSAGLFSSASGAFTLTGDVNEEFVFGGSYYPGSRYKAFNFSGGSHTHTLSVDSTGSSGTGANMPPYYALCYIMKTTGGL